MAMVWCGMVWYGIGIGVGMCIGVGREVDVFLLVAFVCV